jgi:hypothetical protein
MRFFASTWRIMRKQQIAFIFILTHVWVVMIFSGGLVFDTLIVYPNVFYDVPRSLDTAMAFAVVRGPSDFFPPVGTLALLTGIGTLILGWRVKSARYWILGSVTVILVGEFLLSAVFFWPRNTIMFEEGTAVHSVAYLKQTAREFQAGHWLRLAMGATASALSFVGFLKFYRHRIASQETPPGRKDS